MTLPKESILFEELGHEETWATALCTHLILERPQKGFSGSAVAKTYEALDK